MEVETQPPHLPGGALADLVGEYGLLSDDEIDGELRRLELARREVEARMAAVVAVGGARGVHLRDGHRSSKQWVRATLNCSGAEAFRWRRRATLVDRLPVVGDRWLGGTVGREQVDAMAAAFANPRCGDDLFAVAADLVGHAEQLELDDFATVVKQWETLADADGAFDERREAHARRRANVVADEHGLVVAAVGGDPVTAAEVQRIFERAVDAEYGRDVRARRDEWGELAELHPLSRTAEQRRYDALVAVFRAAVSAPAGGRRPEPVVDIIIDARTLGDTLHAHGITGENPFGLVEHPDIDRLLATRCQTDGGTLVDPDLALAAALSGHVRRVVVDSNSVIIDHGERRRLFTGSARTAAKLLTTTCAHRGCDIPVRWCQVDHIDEHHTGGPTDQANAGVLCGYHNRFKHRRRWRLRRSTDGRLHAIRPDGTTLRAAGQPEPHWPDEPEPDA